MSDLISRQDALEAFGLSEKTRKYGGDHSGYDTRMLYEIQDVLEGLPSAQPDIIRCGECRHLHDNDCPVVGWGRDDDDYCAWAERDNDG